MSLAFLSHKLTQTLNQCKQQQEVEVSFCILHGYSLLASCMSRDKIMFHQVFDHVYKFLQGERLSTITGLDWTGLDYWTLPKIESLSLYNHL